MMLILALAGCPAEDSGDDDTGSFEASDIDVEWSGTPVNECNEVERLYTVSMQFEVTVLDELGFNPGVEAELRIAIDPPVEFHPLGGPLDVEDRDDLKGWQAELEIGSPDWQAGVSTQWDCDPQPLPLLRVYDEDGKVMTCFAGAFVVGMFDLEGCPNAEELRATQM
jgi:hypothetical protein